MSEVADKPRRTKREAARIPALFCTRDQAPDVVGLALTIIDGLEARGDFPKRRQLSDRRVGYLMRELEEWAESRPPSDLLPVPQKAAA